MRIHRFVPAVLLGVAACGGSDGPVQPPVPILTAITVSLSAATIRPGETALASASGTDQNGAPIAIGTIIWSTTSSAVATVSSAGVVTGVAAGVTQVVASAGGKQGLTSIAVQAPVSTVVVTPSNLSLSVGATSPLAVVLRDAGNNALTGRAVTWTSSNAAIAGVSSTGVVTGVGVGGPATITATSEGKSGSTQVSVTPPPVASVTVTPSPVAVAAGEATQLTATLRDANNTVVTGRVIAWASSNPAIAAVSAAGLVTGVAAGGPVSITATSEGQSGSSQITVTPPPVRTVSVQLLSSVVTVGQSTQATATARDAHGNALGGRVVAWSSTNPSVASVTASGVVTGIATGGPVSITATSEGVAGSSDVTVVPSSGVSSVTVTPTAESLRGSTPGFGWTRQLIWSVNGSSGISQAVTFSSTNSRVATVSATGLVTAGAAGTTQVRVTSTFDTTKFGTFDVTVVDGCVQNMPVPLGYTMAFTFMCSSGTDRFTYIAPSNTWVQLEVNVSASVGSCSTFLIPFEYVVGNSSTARGYSRNCNVLAGTWAFVRAGPNRFNIQKGNPFAISYSYTKAKISTVPALPQCTPFSTDYGVTFSVDLSLGCTSHLALLAMRNGSVGVTASSSTAAIVVELVNANTGTIMATATSSAPGTPATVSLPAVTTADVVNIRIKPAAAGGVGPVVVVVSP